MLGPGYGIVEIGFDTPSPALIMQGATTRAPKYESDQVVAAIRRNGVETWYVVFADEAHGFLKKPNDDLRREVETAFPPAPVRPRRR